MGPKLNLLGSLLLHVVELLPDPNKRRDVSARERDNWRTVWMMLVGSWHLLRTAQPFVDFADSAPINYDRAEEFARELLRARVHREQDWLSLAPHPWPAGFYLLSAEHRVANSVDRLTKVFAGQALSAMPCGDNLYERCKGLALWCPHCRQETYYNDVRRARELLSRFGQEGGRAPTWPSLRLARVYMRVNEIKHGKKNQPPIAMESTRARWFEAARALAQLTRLLREFAIHRDGCTCYRPLTTESRIPMLGRQ